MTNNVKLILDLQDIDIIVGGIMIGIEQAKDRQTKKILRGVLERIKAQMVIN